MELEADTNCYFKLHICITITFSVVFVCCCFLFGCCGVVVFLLCVLFLGCCFFGVFLGGWFSWVFFVVVVVCFLLLLFVCLFCGAGGGGVVA